MTTKFGKLSVLILLGITIFSFLSTENAEAKKRRTYRKVDVLVADRVKPSYETAIIDSLMLDMELALEEAMFPSNEIYADQWNTEYLKAYSDMQVPDSVDLDISEFVMPVIKSTQVNSNYGLRRNRFHYGTDLKIQTGDTIVAAFNGKVRVKKYQRGGYGYYLVLRHFNGLETVYGHLSGFLVYQDQYVQAGQPIALGGNTGRSTGPHLHFEFRFMGQSINPGEIIDFQEMTLKDDQYRFVKAKSSKSYSASSNSYTAGGSQKMQYHRIKTGETLGMIARKHGVPLSELCRLNNLKPTSTIHAGRSIRIS
ncbi:MAG: peptidoglycan DD-metalloendopeptidase family protein [Candidatus Symbiothrix sp.]|jgi:murein DD-endopeptidase MepM/ murein hydrolase activator NlpD|nr:peptidoglycan DD-metalloendopeptidase family protein [Candidatus Symbiothrix sp.]